MKNILQKLYYYSPYIPIIGVIVVYYCIIARKYNIIITDSPHWIYTLIIQLISIATLIVLI